MPIKDWSCPGHVALPEVTSKSGWVITTKTSICDSRDPVASLINSLIRQVINQLSSHKSATNPMKSLFFAWLTHYVPMVFLCFFKPFSHGFPSFSNGFPPSSLVFRLGFALATRSPAWVWRQLGSCERNSPHGVRRLGSRKDGYPQVNIYTLVN